MTTINETIEAIHNWDCENIYELGALIRDAGNLLANSLADNRLENLIDFAYRLADLPTAGIPDDIDTSYPVWACDVQGRCLVGNLDRVQTLDEIRAV